MDDGQDEIVFNQSVLIFTGTLNILGVGGNNYHFIFNEDVPDGISVLKQGTEITIKIDRQSQIQGQWLSLADKRQLFVSGSNTFYLGISGVRLNDTVINLFLNLYRRTA